MTTAAKVKKTTTNHPQAWRIWHGLTRFHSTFFVIGDEDEPHVGPYGTPLWVGCYRCGVRIEDVSSYADCWGP